MNKLQTPGSRLALCLLLPLTLAGCGLLDIGGLSCRSFPSRRNQVVPPEASLRISFSRPVVPRTAEPGLRVTAGEEDITGNLSWKGAKELRFRPDITLTPGRRHLLQFRASVRVRGGGSYRLDHRVPFYAGHRGPPMRLLSVAPGDGGIIAASDPLVLTFSSPPVPHDFRRCFSLSPAGELLFQWDEEEGRVTVTAAGGWDNLRRYRWEVLPGCGGRDGEVLADGSAGSFFVQEDTTPPQFAGIRAFRGNSGSYVPAEEDQETLYNGDALGLLFSERVSEESLRRALSFTPSLNGRLEPAGPQSYLYIPSALLEPEQEYRLHLSRELQDCDGNSALQEAAAVFYSGVPLLQVERIDNCPAGAEPSWSQADFTAGSARPIKLNEAGGFSHSFTLRFSAPFPTAAGKLRAERAVSCRAYFPPDLTHPEPVARSWLGERELTLVYRGFAAGDGEYPRYYCLQVAAGPEGARNEVGSYLREELCIVLYPQQD